jgi:hypothetical protein
MKVWFEVVSVSTNRTPGQPSSYNYILTADPDEPENKEFFAAMPTASINMSNIKNQIYRHGTRVRLDLEGEIAPMPEGGEDSGQPPPAQAPPPSPPPAPPVQADQPRRFGGGTQRKPPGA